MFTLLWRRNFALLWFGGLISMVGNWMLHAALPYYVYQQTQSTMATAVMLAAELAPYLFLGSLAGVFVDRWDRKRVLVIASSLQGGVVLLLLLVRSPEWVWVVYVVSFIQTCIGTFFGPAEGSLLPRLVGEELLLPAQSLNALNNRFARLIGPPLGGVLLGTVGLPGVVVIDSATFLIAALMIAGITVSPKVTAAPLPAGHIQAAWSQFWVEWREGIQIIRKEHVISTLFIVLMLMNFGGIMIDPLYPGFIEAIVGAGPQAFGWLMTVHAIGGILGGVLLSQMGQGLPATRLLAWGSIAGGIIGLVMFNLPILAVTFAASFISGLPSVATSTAADTLVLTSTPEAYRGRVIGALSTTIALVSLVSVVGLAGVLGELLGIVTMLNVASGLNILAGFIGLTLLPRAARTGMVLGVEDELIPEDA